MLYNGKSFVGCFNANKQHDSLGESNFLFPAYIAYCKRVKEQPVSHRSFSKKTI
jgi:hypothetical protein